MKIAVNFIQRIEIHDKITINIAHNDLNNKYVFKHVLSLRMVIKIEARFNKIVKNRFGTSL